MGLRHSRTSTNYDLYIGAIGKGNPARQLPTEKLPTCPTRALRRRQKRCSSGNLFIPESYVSDANSLPDQIEKIPHAITAAELAQWLAVSRITVFKLAKAGRIPCFRVGTCVRFDPQAVAKWLRRV